ncbi:lycopene cyclase domain-containing protein [Lunatimonas salinarum]|uniref:lycopene cyclase domain-containing protein n=1 Tax=Lunatimonas salinarum TaxID=1774590 RepID=UPI001ADFFE3E|nr:lycopene cyclase domain-containing protein [Lunatimonas salinarum]
MENYYYLGLMLFSLSYPLAQSFEHRIQYAKKAYALFPAILAMAFVFILWDHWFTVQGVWGFNPRYILGIYLLELPLEEWAFFLVVPYACVFIYEVLIYFVKKDLFRPVSRYLMYVLIASFVVLGLVHFDKMYTGINFLFTSAVITAHLLIFKDVHFGRFLMAYLVSLIPFFLINGVLTGSWIDEPIVWYNNGENLGIRLGTIPIEDSVYNLGMLLMVVTIYEKIKERKTFQKGQS